MLLSPLLKLKCTGSLLLLAVLLAIDDGEKVLPPMMFTFYFSECKIDLAYESDSKALLNSALAKHGSS